mmetsp:Transcript_41863/g.30739  ORF Transcript_41863/g.30739 Transcript_41863/m.30739 type:complete len:88 (+) Transcript_41863:816-1079(+)
MVAWMATGLAAGAFEAAHAYTLQRKQFKKPIASFQLVQEKLVRMLSKLSSMISLLHRVTTLLEKGKATIAMCSMAKAHCCKEAREIV